MPHWLYTLGALGPAPAGTGNPAFLVDGTPIDESPEPAPRAEET